MVGNARGRFVDKREASKHLLACLLAYNGYDQVDETSIGKSDQISFDVLFINDSPR